MVSPTIGEKDSPHKEPLPMNSSRLTREEKDTIMREQLRQINAEIENTSDEEILASLIMEREILRSHIIFPPEALN